MKKIKRCDFFALTKNYEIRYIAKNGNVSYIWDLKKLLQKYQFTDI